MSEGPAGNYGHSSPPSPNLTNPNHRARNHGCEALAKGFKGNRCLRRLNVRENPFGDEGRWAIGGELHAKKKKYWKKQKEKRTYEGNEYRAPTQREKDLAIPKIDFANLNIEPRPVLAWAVMTECPKCVCTVM